MEQRDYPGRPFVGVGAIVFDEDKILLVKRKYAPKANYWTLPGGLVRKGETVREALKREVREECGLEADTEKLIDVIDYIEKDQKNDIKYHYVLVDFEVVCKPGSLFPSSDVLDARWVSLKDIKDVRLPKITRKFLNKHYRIG